MKNCVLKRLVSVLLLCSCLLLSGCGEEPEPPPTPNPHAGMVEVESGFGTTMWVKEYENLPVNPLGPEDFSGGRYVGGEYLVRRGIDVSEHQGEIDWAAVKGSGVEFAVLRAGYRGYGAEGNLHEDQYFQKNLEGVLSQGLDLGIYFFSQATGPEEALEEAEFLLSLLSACPPEALALQVYYDWEAIGVEEARTDGMTGETITRCAAAFCQRIAAAGYRPGIYAYRELAYFTYELPALRYYPLWIGAIGSYPDFYYAHELWQYSVVGQVPGIAADVDLDYLFQKPPSATERASETAP